MRLIVVVDVFAAIISVGGSILLIPIYGALGAAVATSATLIAQNLLYQRALARSSVGVPERRHVMTFVAIAAMIALLCLLQYRLPAMADRRHRARRDRLARARS